jgi:hypothetical protein
MRGKQRGNLRRNFVGSRGQYSRDCGRRRAVGETDQEAKIRQIRCGICD